MKEPVIVQAINNLDGISEEEKKGYIELIKKTFYYNPDDYYKFSGLLSSIGVTDTKEFFNNFRVYLEIRSTLDEQISMLTSKNNAAKVNLSNLESTCLRLRQKCAELTSVQEIVKSIMSKLSGEEAQALLLDRENSRCAIKDVEDKIEDIKADDASFKEEMRTEGGISSRIKSFLNSRKAKRRISRLESSIENVESDYSHKCNAVVRLFNSTVVEMPEDHDVLLEKYRNLGGFENFFAIKYDFNWFLHHGEIGRLNYWLKNLKSAYDEAHETLIEETDLAHSLREKIALRDNFLDNYMEQLDLFHLDSDKRKIFEDYTKRYPNLSEFSTDELSDLDEQSDARVLFPLIVDKAKVKSLKRTDITR